MALYRANVAHFDVPDSWKEQSIIAFKLPAPPGGAEGSFVVTRDDGKGVKPFDEYVSEQLDNCRRGLPKFKLIESRQLVAQGLNAALNDFTWSKDGNTLQLRQVFFDCGYFATICTLTCNPRDIKYFDAAWQQVMASLHFDRIEPAQPFQPQAR